jgi:hypothetical protein
MTIVTVPKLKWFIAILLCCLCGMARAQSTATDACSLPTPPKAPIAANIFNEQQEQDLGDALGEYEEPGLRLAPRSDDDRLTLIGEKLLSMLPPSGIHYEFRIYESGQINAFSTAGGRVYISRKLVAAVENEDELAGVIAHEIGHLATHQMAIGITRGLRVRLGITQVTDRADIFAKVHLLFTTRPKNNEVDVTEGNVEIVADQMAMYGMVRAGYAPRVFADFFDQVTLNKGKKGNRLSDFLGFTHQNAQRYRAALKQIEELPSGCKERKPAANEEFVQWQKKVASERVTAVAEGIEGDKPVTLNPALRPSLSRIRFSPDGHLLLAQDEDSITVVDKDAGKVLFRIDAPGAERPQFTTDSKNVIFHDSRLRVEEWSVAEGKRTSVKELIVFGGCTQSLLAPDGKTFACAYGHVHGEVLQIGIRLIDVDSGKSFFEKDSFFEPGIYTPYAMRIYMALRTNAESELMNMLVSQEGKYLLLVAGDKVLAYDLTTRQPVALGGRLKALSQARMSFLESGELYAIFEPRAKGMYAARVLSFPEGEIVRETEIGNQQLSAVTKGHLLAISPLKDYPVGIFDPIEGKVLSAAKLSAIDAWETTVAHEDALGGIALTQIGVAGVKHIPLSLGPMPRPQEAVFSPDGKYLAVSLKIRATVWDLEAGKQVETVRPFSSAWMNSDDGLFGLFPKYMDRDPAALQLTMNPFDSTELAKPEEIDRQFHDLVYTFRSLEKKAATAQNHLVVDRTSLMSVLMVRTSFLPRRNASLEMRKMSTQTVAWSRDYPDEAPECLPSEDNRLVLAWDLGTATAQSEIKKYPALQKQVDAMKAKKMGLLIETVVPETGAPLEEVAIPEANPGRGWSEARKVMVSGKYVLVRGDDRVTSIYRMEDGAKVGEFFGRPIAMDAASGVIVSVNRENEIRLVSGEDGSEMDRYSFASPVRTAQIVGDKVKVLAVLTADQVVHRLPLGE